MTYIFIVLQFLYHTDQNVVVEGKLGHIHQLVLSYKRVQFEGKRQKADILGYQ
jgi:hypothetical protein